MGLGRAYHEQNRQKMDKEGKGIATKKLQMKVGQAEYQVETKLLYSHYHQEKGGRGCLFLACSRLVFEDDNAFHEVFPVKRDYPNPFCNS